MITYLTDEAELNKTLEEKETMKKTLENQIKNLKVQNILNK